ncbi:MAG: hypothetical protein IIZ92_09305 [Aquincola sp.]|nr:hypothetical protein [Aquincola sp.]
MSYQDPDGTGFTPWALLALAALYIAYLLRQAREARMPRLQETLLRDALRDAQSQRDAALSLLGHWKDIGVSYRDGAISDEELLQQIDGLLTMEELAKQHQGY